MAQQTELDIAPREVMGKNTKRLRKVGIIPANIFGHKEESQAVQIDAVAFDRLRRSHGATGIITLNMAGNNGIQTALIRHVQHDPRSGKVLHVDFFRVSMNESLRVKVALRFVGEAPAVKFEGGVLLHLLDTLEVECLGREIPEYIEVDVSSLSEIDDILHAGDIKLPPNANAGWLSWHCSMCCEDSIVLIRSRREWTWRRRARRCLVRSLPESSVP